MGVSDEEAQEILAYDKVVSGPKKVKTPYDLTPEQEKISRFYCRTGTREVDEEKKTKRERKPNATKVELINAFVRFLSENETFAIENVQIPNKERLISFSIGADSFEITLVQKRKPKK